MKKNINKAILFETLSSSKVFIAINFLILISASMLYNFINNQDYINGLDCDKFIQNGLEDNLIYIMLTTIALNMIIAIGIFGLNKHKKMMLLSAGPFSRKDIIVTKALVAYGLNIINALVFLYFAILNYIKIKPVADFYDNYRELLVVAFITMLIFGVIFCTISLLVFVSTNFSMVAFLTVSLIITFPILFPIMFVNSIFGGYYEYSHFRYYWYGFIDIYPSFGMKVYGAVILLLVVATISYLIFKLSIVKTFKAVKIENIKKLYNNIFVEKVVLIMVTLLSAEICSIIVRGSEIILSDVFSINYFRSTSHKLILFVVFAIVLYMLYSKLYKKFSRG